VNEGELRGEGEEFGANADVVAADIDNACRGMRFDGAMVLIRMIMLLTQISSGGGVFEPFADDSTGKYLCCLISIYRLNFTIVMLPSSFTPIYPNRWYRVV
jgi:hypothetical protein